jgi:hypothetical protein
MHADILYHTFDISLQGIHDTQVWDSKISGCGRLLNLVKTLEANDIPTNDTIVSNSIDEFKFKFWADRPLTHAMTDSASNEVSNFIQLHSKQQIKAQSLVDKHNRKFYGLIERCKAESDAIARTFPRSYYSQIKIRSDYLNKFIGKDGENILKLTKAIPGSYYQILGKPNTSGHITIGVYGKDNESMTLATIRMRAYQ